MGTPGPDPTTSLDDTLAVFTRLDDPCTPLTATEVAEALGCTRRTAFGKLEALAERGDLASKKTGARGRVWWRPHAVERVDEAAPSELGRSQFESFVRAVVDYAIFTLDPDGRIVSWNAGAERIKGYSEDEILGEHVSTFYTDVDTERGVPEQNLAGAAEVGRLEDEGWRVRRDGSRFWANVVLTAIHDDDGELQGFTKVTRDMTERRNRERRYDAIFNHTFQFTGLMEPDGTLVEANETALSFGGLDRDDVIGEPFWEAGWWQVSDAARDQLKRAIERAAEGEFVRYEVDVQGADQVVTIDFSIRPVLDERGDVEYLIPEGRDITERREREAALRRERDLLDEVLETSPVAIAVVDGTGGLVRANTRAEETPGVAGAAPDGAAVGSRAVYDDIGQFLSPSERPAGRVLRTGEPVVDEHVQIESDDGERNWLSVNATPIHDADGEVERVVIAAEDITTLKEQARQLERQRDDLEAELDEVFDRVTDAFYALDEEWRFTYVNERAEEIIQRSEADVLGERLWDVFPETAAGPVWEQYHEAMETQEPVSFERFNDPLDAWLEFTAYPSASGLSVYFRDVTERKQREQELEEYETIVETIDDGVYAVDDDYRFVTVNQAYADLVGHSKDGLVGSHVSDVVSSDIVEMGQRRRAALLAGEATTNTVEVDMVVADGEEVTTEIRYAPLPMDDGEFRGTVGVVRDVTGRKERERELAEQRERYRGLVEAAPVGIAILAGDGRIEYVNDAALDLVGAAEPDDLLGEDALEFIHAADRADANAGLRRVIETREPTPTTELRLVGFDGSGGEVRYAMVNSVPVTYRGEPASQTVLVDLTEQKEREAQLARQREQLALLDQLNGVVQDVTHTVIESATRDEIEAQVCERLGASDSYRFAWIGSVGHDDRRVRDRAAAGIDGGLDGLTVTADDSETGRGPTSYAARNGDIYLTQRLQDHSAGEPWREHALEHGVQAIAAIPIEYEDTIYGVLTVGSARPNAFDPDESDIVARLGEVVGHAITAVERKQALVSEELVELRLRVGNVFDSFGGPTADGGTVRFAQTVPVDEETFLVYGSVTGDATVALEAMADELPNVESAKVIDESATDPRFELRLSAPPVIHGIASYGGRVESAVIEDGNYDLVVHVPPGTEIRGLVEAARETYPNAAVVAQRRTTRADPSLQRTAAVLSEGLTDRQRAALEAAFYAGFFNWPRDRTGEEIADSLRISPSTFHQHLRLGERKLMRALFEGAQPAD